MAGKKGRSGRKSRYREVEEGKLENVCTNYLLDNFETFSPAIKQKIALTIASKAVTQKSEVKNDTTYREAQQEDLHEAVRSFYREN